MHIVIFNYLYYVSYTFNVMFDVLDTNENPCLIGDNDTSKLKRKFNKHYCLNNYFLNPFWYLNSFVSF